uniref:Zinc finger CCCH domain-containing protein 44-like isoform X1 n=1 Tax=Cymbidium ensifolium TaxID=78740 RepID=A0A5J6N913_CYMEN|nr:zinc finger CCCH domain-containing protein 44-like isoform X1 [Cymbidium ensifolium]
MSTEPFDKEAQSEDYCFVCKDGGHLRLCDHKDCTKSYHPECVNKDPTFLDADETWTCGWHSCFICFKRSTFKCFCCPTSFCRICVRKAEFGWVKEVKGFCGECLRLVKLVEDCTDIDSDEEKVDFDDRDTWEFLFKDYWPIVKRKEGLTKENVRYADTVISRVFKGNNWSDPDVSSDHLVEVSDSEDNSEDEDHPMMDFKWKMDRKSTMRKKLKPSKNEFVSWCSMELLKFLAVLGKETKEPLEKFDVYEIVRDYILSKGLLHHDKRGRKYAISDSTLHCLVRRRRFKLSRIYTLLERHFSSSDGSLDEFSSSEEDMYAKSRKRKGTPRFDSNVTWDSKVRCDSKVKPDRHLHNEPLLEPPKSCFAQITRDTIKAVYLKRSLIVELLKDPTTFETKVIGCFVRFKVDPKGFNGTPWMLYQLGQVTAVKKVLQEYKFKEMSTDLVLCISNISIDVKISMLSDDDFEEEECKELHQLVNTGFLQRPSIVELEKKISMVHEDIVKHSINKELLKLDKLIERANEKGWRKELYEYMDRKKLLSKPEEVTRLIKVLPRITADTTVAEESFRTSLNNAGESKQGLSALPAPGGE